MARNVQMQVEGNTLYLSIDLAQEGKESKQGKSIVIGSTEGNVALSHNGRMYKVGLNVYVPKE